MGFLFIEGTFTTKSIGFVSLCDSFRHERAFVDGSTVFILLELSHRAARNPIENPTISDSIVDDNVAMTIA